MFNNSGDRVCELPESHTSSSSDWGQFRRSVLFPPLGNCNSTTEQEKVSSPLATTVSGEIEYSTEYSWTQKNLPTQEEKENSSFDNISFSEKHRLHFPVNINRQSNSYNHKKLKPYSKNSVAGSSNHTHLSKPHHNNNSMKFRNLLSNISKAVGGNNSNSPPSASTMHSQHKGKTLQIKLTLSI